MNPAVSDPLFAVGFTVFVIAFVVLTVLVVRFTLRRGRIAKQAWLEARNAGIDGDPGSRDGEQEDPEPRLTALVLAGGGPRGAAQVGMLQVLAENDIVPDRIYGASVGAVNGAAFAGDPTVSGVERLAGIWRGISGDDVYPSRFVHGPWQLLQHRESMYPNTGLRKIIEDGITYDRLEEAVIPIEVVATSIIDGRERWLMAGPAVEAVLASAAIPALFPPVEIDGDRLVDGGVVDNVPISRAIDAGATRIFVLLCGPLTFTPPPSKRPVEVMLSALFISVHARFSREMARLPPGVEMAVFSVDDTTPTGFTDFSETEALIAAGRVEATEVLRRHGLIAPAEPTSDRIPPERTSEDLSVP
ncbi:MAG: patatin-like phospholipase family protein [Acidimicrobiales bacterium]